MGEVDRGLALLDSPADKGRTLSAFAYTGHIADDEALALLHLIDGKGHTVYLLGGKMRE